jgi:beta-glucosidase
MSPWFGTHRRATSQLLLRGSLVAALLGAACTTTEQTTAPTTTAPDTPSTTATVAAQPVSLAPDPLPGEVYYAPFPLSITLDGGLSDWEDVPTVVIPPTADVVIGSTSVEFAAAADDEFLYLMGDVTDAGIVTGQHGTDYWNEDSVEFYINGTGDLTLTSYADGVAQVTVPPLNASRAPGELIIGGVQGESAEATGVVVETSTGYAMELAVPLKNRVWNIQREHGSTIGFQVHLNSASESSRDLKAIWSTFDTGDTSYLNPSVFGQLTFFRIGETDIEVAAPPVETVPPEPVPDNAAYKQSVRPDTERVADLLSRMTLAEKVGQMTLVEKNSIVAEDITAMAIGGLLSGGGGSPDENSPQAWAAMVEGFQEQALASRLGVPLLYGVDAVHGHNNVRGAVIFPHNVGLGAANDPELMERIGRITAAEMIATGIYWNYAPAVSVPRDIRWGRTYEGYSESTELVSDLAAAYLRGLQGEDLADPGTVLATPKHYVGDGGTTWGSSTTGDYSIDQGATEVGEDLLRAIHLPPFVRAIDEGAASIMVSYSSWGGAKMHAQRYLITDVLKGELGYSGFVVSDWGAIDQIANDYYEAVVTAINAGIDMNMVPYDYRRFITTLTRAVEAGDVAQSRIDDAVERILTAKFALGLFERPYGDDALVTRVGSEEHRAVAREAVAKSQVLLKDDADLLPLATDMPLLFVGGEAADDLGIQSGGWTIEWQGGTGEITEGTTILEATRDTVSANTTVLYDEFGRFEATASGGPVVCIGVVGEDPYAEGVGDDAELGLRVADLRLLARMRDQCDRLAVVLLSGRPLIVTDLIDDWDALVASWLPGSEGQGVADVLFGLEPFTGTLPYTWPRTVEQLPIDQPDVEADPLFPLGFGS